MTLGDFFPEGDKENYVNRHLKPGQVVYLFSHFTNPPKEKYLVIAYYGTNPLLFTINSKIHPYIASRPDLSKCQVSLRAMDYDFLDHDSYINCSKVVDSFSEDEIRRQWWGSFVTWVKQYLAWTGSQVSACFDDVSKFAIPAWMA